MRYVCEFTKCYFIYKITNTINGKVYIGRTADPRTRYKRYCYTIKNIGKHNIRIRSIHRALFKEGIDNFVFEVIERCESYIEAKKREDYYIASFGSSNVDRGYNERGGEVDSESLTEFKARMSGTKNPMFGTKLSKERKLNLSNKFSGSSNPFYGKKHTSDTKKKIGQSSSERNSGAGNPNSKLSVDDVIEIRRRYSSGECSYLDELAHQYNVTTATISNIVRYKTWKMV